MKKMLGLCLLVAFGFVGCGGRTEEAPAAKEAAVQSAQGMNDYMSKMKVPGASGGAPAPSGPPATATPPAGDTPAATPPAAEPEKK